MKENERLENYMGRHCQMDYSDLDLYVCRNSDRLYIYTVIFITITFITIIIIIIIIMQFED